MSDKSATAPISDRQIQSVFSENLRILIAGEKSIATLCRNLKVNRTQFNRYISGEATPRPILLNRICRYFDVDARILLEPLDQIPTSKPDPSIVSLLEIGTDVVRSVPGKALPDGIFAQWSASLIRSGKITFKLARIYTEDGVRKFRVRVPDPLKQIDETTIYHSSPYVSHGIVFDQGDGFAIVDKNPHSQVITLAAYRLGYSIHPHIFPGMKLSGASVSNNHMHSYGPCFLEKIPNDTGSLLAAARTPYVSDFEDAPDYVRAVLKAIAQDGPEIARPPARS